ncbi:MAG: SUF system NifU family Fe-S cluster assembly protein [Erysipelotrichaceae bacterium]|nr:SUF system NifU family Fe-S cluster assembly protein [Erysipelotrichaceae bacterium]
MSRDLLNDPMILRELIMDHYEYPHNHSLTDNDKYRQVHMASASCIDDIHVQALIEDGIIKDVRFDGVACTISTASTSIMTELVKGKSIEEAQKIIDNYFAMIDGQDYDAELLDEAVCMKNVGRQANRIKCATIGWNGLKKLISGEEEHDG